MVSSILLEGHPAAWPVRSSNVDGQDSRTGIRGTRRRYGEQALDFALILIGQEQLLILLKIHSL